MSSPVLLGFVFGALLAATIIGQILRRTHPSATVSNMNERIATWWVLCGLTALALTIGDIAVMVVFAVFSGLALREFVTVTHSGVFWPCLVFVAVQYGLLWGRSFGLFVFLLPVAALVVAWRGRFVLYFGVMVCVYCFSYAPAVRNDTLLFYFLIVVELSDVMQWVWGKLLGSRPVAPRISPQKTWEGLIGGVLTASAVGTALYRATPFSPAVAAVVCVAVTLAGFAGGLAMSAVKRRYGVKDFGTILRGHGGVLDRIDSLCFAAPVFFYLTRYLP
ncbi:MAG TPA: phosphatidate cytidylyltransferase [Bryobacteraceae bacterium]|nr:phosphatidate cytidylyltransferase [Bryobacteraceae bacterium]